MTVAIYAPYLAQRQSQIDCTDDDLSTPAAPMLPSAFHSCGGLKCSLATAAVSPHAQPRTECIFVAHIIVLHRRRVGVEHPPDRLVYKTSGILRSPSSSRRYDRSMSLGAPELATQAYWDGRYADEDAQGYDWFKKYGEISPFLETALASCGGHDARILILGCGTSSLSAELYDRGYTHVSSIDFSPTAIEACEHLFAAERPGATWQVMDIRKLDFSDGTFDCAIDKGTMDALLCHSGSPWDPPQDVVDNCAAEIAEAARVLRTGGKFLMVSFRPSHFLRPRVQSVEWTDAPEIEQIGDFYYTVSATRR